MTEHELSTIINLPNAAIIAPAGHGKTEMIADLVANASGKQLLLTHTNAGVDVLEKRLKKRNVTKSKYTISTIAAFCIKWCMAYFQNASFDKTLSPLRGGNEAKNYYAQLYYGAKAIFQNNWSGLVLQYTYKGVIVDEYQDCTQEQHEIILAINRFLPVRVLGDPMQGIFSFAGELVDWDNLEFQIVEVETKPWRWQSTNPRLGEFLADIRNQLSPVLSGQRCCVHLLPCKNCVQVLDPQIFDGYKLLRDLRGYSTVLFLSRLEHEQLSFCKRMPGIFQYDEKQDCDVLFKYAQEFDSPSSRNRALNILKFANECATKVNSEVKSFKTKLEGNSCNFSRIRKNADLGELLISVCENNTYSSLVQALSWFQAQSVFKFYRSELFEEMLRSIRYAANNSISVFEAANHIRKDVALQKRYTQFKYLSSRTVLSKGLEFDCVIIDMRDPLPSKDFYVAMTRAMKMIYIISSSYSFNFNN